MADTPEPTAPRPVPPIFVVTGGYGAVGDQLCRNVLAQFPGADVPVVVVSQVHQREQIEQVISQAETSGGVILHTMVQPELRSLLETDAAERGIHTIDVIGPLQDHVTGILKREPLGRPGLYRQLHENYFKRIEGLEFTMAHDDGLNFKTWSKADVLLVGVSRVGKTPLSMYLAMMGWKVANVPLVMEVPPRPELFRVDPRRVVGLILDPGQLLHHREHRRRTLGITGREDYCNPRRLYEEIQHARRIYQKGGFVSVDVTGKPIETTAFQIVSMVKRQLGEEEGLPKTE